MKNYIYGASIQGIQSFIFSTSELREITGASELIETICREALPELLGKDETWIQEHRIIAAAGNIRFLLDEQECRKVVRDLPRIVTEKAPGITISQAVVEYDADFAQMTSILENKLKAQRNSPATPTDIVCLGMGRSRQSGFPLVLRGSRCIDIASASKWDAANFHKLSRKSFGKDPGKKLVQDIASMTSKNDWIAIVHADGNSLGQVVRKVGKQKDQYKLFSEELDRATIEAANEAFRQVIPEDEATYPLLPVILGGDDMTLIIRGDLAIPYVVEYMKAFEKYSSEYLGQLLDGVFTDGTNHLSCCAGIAFIKSSYPFHYGYSLAEELCNFAKKAAKKDLQAGQSARSCILFHKVQDSFITSYNDIIKRELTTKAGISLKGGPYYLNGANDIETLTDLCKELDNDQGVRSGIRQYLTVLHEGSGREVQQLERLKRNHCGAKNLIENLTTKDSNGAILAQDCLSLYTISNQKTK